jgi:hypothetical protein
VWLCDGSQRPTFRARHDHSPNRRDPQVPFKSTRSSAGTRTPAIRRLGERVIRPCVTVRHSGHSSGCCRQLSNVDRNVEVGENVGFSLKRQVELNLIPLSFPPCFPAPHSQ